MINDSSSGKFIFVTVLVPTTFGLSLMVARSSNYMISWGLVVLSLITLMMSLTLMFRFFLNLKSYKKNHKKGFRLFSWLVVPLLGILFLGANAEAAYGKSSPVPQISFLLDNGLERTFAKSAPKLAWCQSKFIRNP